MEPPPASKGLELIKEDLHRGEPMRVTRNAKAGEDWCFFHSSNIYTCVLYRPDRGKMVKQVFDWSAVETVRRMR